MKTSFPALFVGAIFAFALSAASAQERPGIDLAQVPTWTREDMDFFLHGSMSTEVVPERVLKAFMTSYPDLFHGNDLSTFGLLPDVSGGWPIGISRREVPHLAHLSSIGINCAACHVGEITFGAAANPVRVLGMTSHFDAEAFFGAVAVATWRTSDAANMKRYLANYLLASDPQGGTKAQDLLGTELQRQDEKITAAIAADPFGAKGVAAGALYRISAGDVRLDSRLLERHRDLTPLVRSQLQLFHNMRAALHIPDQPPDKAPPASGPGRNDAFGLLSAVLFGTPQPYAPVKYGLVWNVGHRHWVDWDGNTQSPIGRNLLASLGLGAPLIGKGGDLNFKFVKRQTDLAEVIRAPRYPLTIDTEAAQAGAHHYQARCAACHNIPEDDSRLHNADEVGTDPRRALQFTPHQAELFDTFLAELQVDGYKPSKVPGIRSTQKYWAPSLAGVWARSPYLHDGSVRTMNELLTAPKDRAKTFHRGSHAYNSTEMGYADEGGYLFDTAVGGNANAGHNYGTDLSDPEKRELIEYLKTL
jgi:hypothetical protein